MDAPAEARPPLSWPRAAGLAALTAWLPGVVPFAVGPLTECSHCVATYFRVWPVQPGMLAAVVIGGNAAFWVVGGAGTAAVLLVLTMVARWAGPGRWALLGAAMILLGFQALGLSHLLRA